MSRGRPASRGPTHHAEHAAGDGRRPSDDVCPTA